MFQKVVQKHAVKCSAFINKVDFSTEQRRIKKKKVDFLLKGKEKKVFSVRKPL